MCYWYCVLCTVPQSEHKAHLVIDVDICCVSCTPRANTKLTQFSIAMLYDRDNSEDASYWAQYPAVLSDKTEKVWDALEGGLEKYK